MIGQSNLLTIIDEQIMMDEFPRFSIIIGPEGSGKKTLAKAMAFALESRCNFIEPKIDAVREMIKECYTINDTMVYVIADADSMSISAKNAMLKICEETPKKAYIIMTVCDDSSLLDTIKSRASIYRMSPYTPAELLDYARLSKGNLSNAGELIVQDLCETPGDVNKLYAVGVEAFYKFVEKVVDNIAEVSTANALKILDSIDTKGNDEDKYDMVLFLRAFKAVCGKEMRKAVAQNDVEGQMYFSAGIKVASNTLSKMSITGINKGALFDMFILDIRKEWC